MLEARITAPRAPLGLGIHFLEVTQNGVDRGMQAVKVHPIKAGGGAFWIETLVELAQPFDELDHNGVAPHPRSENGEIPRALRLRSHRRSRRECNDEREM